MEKTYGCRGKKASEIPVMMQSLKVKR